MTRFTTIDRANRTMQFALVLAFHEDGGVRMSRDQPRLGPDERAMAMLVTLPSALFSRPSLRAEITIADSGAPLPTINVQAAETALREAIGCDVVVTVQPA